MISKQEIDEIGDLIAELKAVTKMQEEKEIKALIEKIRKGAKRNE